MDQRAQEEVFPLQLLLEASESPAEHVPLTNCVVAAAPALNVPFNYGQFSSTMLRYARAHETSPGQYPTFDIRCFGFCLMHPASVSLVRTFVDLCIGRSPLVIPPDANKKGKAAHGDDAAADDGAASPAASQAQAPPAHVIRIPEEDEDEDGLDDEERAARLERRTLRKNKAVAIDVNALRQLEHNLDLVFDRRLRFVHDVRMRRAAGAIDEDAAAAAASSGGGASEEIVDWELEGFPGMGRSASTKRVAPKPTRAAELKVLVAQGKLPKLRRGASPPPIASRASPAPGSDADAVLYEVRPVEVRTVSEADMVAQIQASHIALRNLVRLALKRIGIQLSTGVLLRSLLTKFLTVTHTAPAMSLFEVCLRSELPPVPTVAERVAQRKQQEQEAKRQQHNESVNRRHSDSAAADDDGAAQPAKPTAGVEIATQTGPAPTKVRVVYVEKKQHPASQKDVAFGTATRNHAPEPVKRTPAPASEESPSKSKSRLRDPADHAAPAETPAAQKDEDAKPTNYDGDASAASDKGPGSSTASEPAADAPEDTAGDAIGDSAPATREQPAASSEPAAADAAEDSKADDRAPEAGESTTEPEAAPTGGDAAEEKQSAASDHPPTPLSSSAEPTPRDHATDDAGQQQPPEQQTAAEQPHGESEADDGADEAPATLENMDDGNAAPTAKEQERRAPSEESEKELQERPASGPAPNDEAAWFEENGDDKNNAQPAERHTHDTAPHATPAQRPSTKPDPGQPHERRPLTSEDTRPLNDEAQPGQPEDRNRRHQSPEQQTEPAEQQQRRQPAARADEHVSIPRDEPKRASPRRQRPAPQARHGRLHQGPALRRQKPAPVAAASDDVAPALRPLLVELAGKYQIAQGKQAPPPANAGATNQRADGAPYAQDIEVALGLRKPAAVRARQEARLRQEREAAFLREQQAGRKLLPPVRHEAPPGDGPQLHPGVAHKSLSAPVQRHPRNQHAATVSPMRPARARASPGGGMAVGGVPFEHLPPAEQRRVIVALAHAVEQQQRDLGDDDDAAATHGTTRADERRQEAAARRRNDKREFDDFVQAQQHTAVFEQQKRDQARQRGAAANNNQSASP